MDLSIFKKNTFGLVGIIADVHTEFPLPCQARGTNQRRHTELHVHAERYCLPIPSVKAMLWGILPCLKYQLKDGVKVDL